MVDHVVDKPNIVRGVVAWVALPALFVIDDLVKMSNIFRYEIKMKRLTASPSGYTAMPFGLYVKVSTENSLKAS